MKEKLFKVTEIFQSIQGEGAQAGMPMVFVRFSGCNLKCKFCDTKHDFFDEMTAKQIVDTVLQKWGKVGRVSGPVCLTGGEPTLQVTPALLDVLRQNDCPIYIETNGTRRLPGLTSAYLGVTVSPKKPMKADQKYEYQCHRASLKIVFDIRNPNLDKIIQTWGSIDWDSRYIQPVYVDDKPINLLPVFGFLAENPGWRLSLQTHKMIGLR